MSNTMTLFELIDSGVIRADDSGAYTGSIAGSKFRIGPGQYPGATWTVTVADKLAVTETDDLDHACRQAEAYARQIEFNICGPRPE
jgi:hypothetical protein